MSRVNTLAGAFLLGIGGIVLIFILGEGVHVPRDVPAAGLWQVVVVVAPLAAFYGAAAYFLSCRSQQPRIDWAMPFALVAPMLFSAILAGVVERNKRNAFAPALITAIGLISSYAGAMVGLRAATRRVVGRQDDA